MMHFQVKLPNGMIDGIEIVDSMSYMEQKQLAADLIAEKNDYKTNRKDPDDLIVYVRYLQLRNGFPIEGPWDEVHAKLSFTRMSFIDYITESDRLLKSIPTAFKMFYAHRVVDKFPNFDPCVDFFEDKLDYEISLRDELMNCIRDFQV